MGEKNSNQMIFIHFHILCSFSPGICSRNLEPYRRSDIDVLEQVQRRFSKFVPKLKSKPYFERREVLGWSTLEERYRRAWSYLGDIQKWGSKVGFGGLYSPAGNTRTCHKVIERQVIRNCGVRHNFFTNRTARNWNTIDAVTQSIKKFHKKCLFDVRNILKYHFRCTIDGPDSSYSCFEIHILWKVDNDARIEPPIHTEYLRSGGAIILIFIELGARAVISFCMRSAMPGYMVVPPDRTVLAYRSFRMSMSHFIIEL
ncbi:dynein heavy chain axonemal [Brachionus plicatilis]|uniref:Dynein heavy chain axonemal n=1 Tax=Brachionus plicatilis TaxID=10195 RepID=A0A3M7RFX1_BRAPC|nr:dynein heavy chain axonemal [Brachionus plicatilis]